MNNREFYIHNILEVKINKKFNIINFLFLPLNEMGEGRVTSANQKNVYLESKNYETKYKNIISEKFTDELTKVNFYSTRQKISITMRK